MEIIENFLKLLTKNYNLPDLISNKILIFCYMMVVLYGFYKFILFVIKKFKEKHIKKLLDKDLHPYFTFHEILKYTKFYIPQYYQNITPSEGDEYGKIHAAAAKSKIMNEFIKKGLLANSPIKYFIILSDTGMGKTAFLINLFIKYKKSNFKLNQIKYNISYIPLGNSDCINKVKLIKDKENTILLLDAFDEDIKAINNYKERMIEILDNVKDFRKVVFTCRTQFFPSKDEEPTDTNDITFGENIKHKIHKLYLSAFDNNDVLKYLLYKYRFNLIKLFKAYKLVKKSPSLMFRPMLLSYIDELIKEKRFYNYSFEMYSVLISNWITRESKKPAVFERATSYSENLYEFSNYLARNIYEERKTRDGYYISINELNKIRYSSKINANDLTIEDKTGRSLLNRNSIGQYKFAHKSILEYLLALEIFKDYHFLKVFDFHGMDATNKFHVEMLANLLKKSNGDYKLFNEIKFNSFSSILPSNIKKIEILNFYTTQNINFKNLAGFMDVKTIVFSDSRYIEIYLIYIIIIVKKRVELNITNSLIKRIFNQDISSYEKKIEEVEQLTNKINVNNTRRVIEKCELDEKLKLIFLIFLKNENQDLAFSYDDLNELRNLKSFVKESNSLPFKNLIIELRNINKLSKIMKKTNLYY